MKYLNNSAAARSDANMTRFRLGAALSVMALSFVTPAMAQDNAPVSESAQAESDEIGIPEILVVGSRLAADPMKIPMAIQDVSTEQLQDLRIVSVSALATVAPTFRVQRSYQGTPQYSIRGIGFNAINLSSSPTVTLYQDDIAYPYPFTHLGPMYDIGGAQVLKGPQGTVFGRNTTAGVINLTSAQPTEEFSGSLATEVGNYETLNFEGFLSGRIAPWLKARVAFRTEHSMKGWQVSKSRPDERLGEIHNTGARLILAADPAPGLDITLTLLGWKNESDTRAGQAIGLTPGTDSLLAPGNASSAVSPQLIAYLQMTNPRTPMPWANSRLADWSPATPSTQPGFTSSPGRALDLGSSIGMPGKLNENTDFWSAALKVGVDLSSDLRLLSLTSFQRLNRDSLQDVSGAPFEVLVQNPKGRIETVTQELRLEGDLGRFKWAIGGYYGRDKIDEDIRSLIHSNANSTAIRANLPTITSLGYMFIQEPYRSYIRNELGDYTYAFRTLRDTANYDITTKSVLGNVDWEMSDRLTLSLGGRYTWDRLEFNGCTRDVNGNTNQGANAVLPFLIKGGAFGTNDRFIPTELSQTGDCVTMYAALDLDDNGNPVANPDGSVKLIPPYVRQEVVNLLKEENFSWRAALNWRASDEVMFYLSASRGYKSGVNPLNTANSSFQDAPVRQEKLTAYEGGVRARFSGAQFSLGGFYYDYRDKQLTGYYKDPVFTTLARLINVPKSRAWGLEADWSIDPFAGLTLFGNALYLDTKITDFPTAAEQVGGSINELGIPADYTGSSFGNPKWSLSGGASLTVPLSSNFAVRATGNYNWRSRADGPRSYMDATRLCAPEGAFGNRCVDIPAGNSPLEEYYDIGSYGILNGSITLIKGEGDLEFSIWGRNITQTYYPITIYSNATTISKLPGDPRTYGATLRVNF